MKSRSLVSVTDFSEYLFCHKKKPSGSGLIMTPANNSGVNSFSLEPNYLGVLSVRFMKASVTAARV